MNATPRMIGGLLCLAAGLTLLVLPQEAAPWLPGSMGAGVVLCVSGAMFLIRAYAARQGAPGAGGAPARPSAPAKGKRRRGKKS
ncbi:MAG: hypothetical protein AB1916_10215 [Thermodesulfobacteriota bacterium]